MRSSALVWLAALGFAGCSPDALGQGEGSTSSTGTTAGTTSGPATSTTSDSTGAVPTSEGSSGSGSVDEDSSSGGPPLDPLLLAHFDTFAAPAVVGPQAINGVGFQPRAVLFWITANHPGEASVDPVHFGRGWSDGTNHGAVATAWQSGTDDVSSRWIDTACITLVGVDNSDLFAEAAVASLDPDGFTLEWSIPGDGRQVAFLALGGDIEARVGNVVLSAPTETIDEVEFQPDVVLLAGVQTLATPTTNNRGGHGFGVSVPSDSTHSSAHREREGGGNDGSSGLVPDVALVLADDTDPEDSYTLAGVDANGFGLNRQTGNDAIGTTWLALSGLQAQAGVLAQPAMPGEQPVPVDFPPVVVMFDGGDKPDWGPEPEIVHGVAVGTVVQAGLWLGRNGQSNQSVWDMQHALISRLVGERMPTGAASVSMAGSDGFTLDWVRSDGLARQVGWLALGSPPPP